MKRTHGHRGFTLVEIAVGIALIGLVLLAFAGMTSVVQKSAGRTRQYADAQQNARAALDYLTSQLRSAGSDVAAYDGQGIIVFAGPDQVAFNADIDAGQVVDGEQPMTAIDIAQSPSTVPSSGTNIYTPLKTFKSGAETVVFTLDSDASGVVDNSDQGDDDEEKGHNPHLYVLKQYRYGASGGANEVRDSDVAIVRGPVAYDNGDNPPPLFEYYYDDDNDLSTPDKLFGDTDGDLKLSSSEIASVGSMPANKLFGIRLIKINVVAEGTQVATRDNEGFAHVVMSSRVYIRNADSHDAAQIYGAAYFDANKNSVRDTGESGLPNVVIKISQSGRKTSTDQFGMYNIPLNGGTYTVVETVPAGYAAATPASVNVTIKDGEVKNVNYGCKTAVKSGYVVGKVWDDINKNGVNDGELGLKDVVVSLSNGMTAKTSGSGRYQITTPVGSYTVTETDPTGYASTTSNTGAVTLINDQDSVVVNFGDAIGGLTGTLSGYVYEDKNKDGVRGGSEAGISGVSLTTSTNKTATTDNAGFYKFDLDPGKYDVYELDLTGYTSTTANIVNNITITTGNTVTQDFGDILMKDLTFVEVSVSNTQKPLSVSVGDLKEDNRDDPDIVLGTPTAANNMFLYLNAYVSGATPLTSLFTSTPSQSYKSGTTDVNAIKWMERNGDSYTDVMSGQESSGNNLIEWYNDDKKAQLGKASGGSNKTSSSGLSCATTRFKIADMDKDGRPDVIIGHKSKVATYAGGFEEQLQIAPGTFTSKQVTTTNGMSKTLGIVAGLATGDLDKDGDQDLVVGSNNGNTWGHIDIFLNNGTGTLTWSKRLLAKGGVNDIAVADLQNDGLSEPDILVGITQAVNVGGVQVWLNKNGVYGVDDKTGFVYDNDTDHKVPDKFYNAGGEVLAVAATRLDADIYPEIIMGTRSSTFYTGSLLIVQEPGTANERTTNVKVNVAGEVVSFDIADMNKDSYLDIVVTTRTSASAGKLAIYFLNNIYALP